MFQNAIRSMIYQQRPDLPLIGFDTRDLAAGIFTPAETQRLTQILEEMIQIATKSGYRVRLYAERSIESVPLSLQKIMPVAGTWQKTLAREHNYSPMRYLIPVDLTVLSAQECLDTLETYAVIG